MPRSLRLQMAIDEWRLKPPGRLILHDAYTRAPARQRVAAQHTRMSQPSL